MLFPTFVRINHISGILIPQTNLQRLESAQENESSINEKRGGRFAFLTLYHHTLRRFTFGYNAAPLGPCFKLRYYPEPCSSLIEIILITLNEG